ncbi:MAG: TIM barrel protein [Candidatus Dormibacteraceae bacterium]
MTITKPKVAGAPTSWGVIELSSWGYRMAPDRVLDEMRSVGLEATELGPPGYFPEDPRACRELLARHGMRLVAGFLATVLHDPEAGAPAQVERQARTLQSAGAEVLVLAAALPGDTYDRHEELSAEAWRAMRDSIAAAEDIAARHGLRLAFHPHVGTAVENREEVDKLLSTTDVDLCLDTGHLYLGGSDPVRLAVEAGARIGHVHLKDVAQDRAARVRSGELTYADAVRSGLYVPLGQGGLDIEAVVSRLKEAGYQGWFVLEQDTALTAEPEPASGPIEAALQSLEHFRLIIERQSAHHIN